MPVTIPSHPTQRGSTPLTMGSDIIRTPRGVRMPAIVRALFSATSASAATTNDD